MVNLRTGLVVAQLARSPLGGWGAPSLAGSGFLVIVCRYLVHKEVATHDPARAVPVRAREQHRPQGSQINHGFDGQASGRVGTLPSWEPGCHEVRCVAGGERFVAGRAITAARSAGTRGRCAVRPVCGSCQVAGAEDLAAALAGAFGRLDLSPADGTGQRRRAADRCSRAGAG